MCQVEIRTGWRNVWATDPPRWTEDFKSTPKLGCSDGLKRLSNSPETSEFFLNFYNKAAGKGSKKNERVAISLEEWDK